MSGKMTAVIHIKEDQDGLGALILIHVEMPQT